MPATTASPALDLDALRERYRIERERRTPGADDRRYRDVEGDFARFSADPSARADADRRDPLTDTVDVLVVGGGFGGLLSAARLREAGVPAVRIVEAGGDVGGTWYWNRYRARRATSNPTSISRCWRRRDTCPSNATPRRRRLPRTAPASRIISGCTTTRCSRRR